MIFAMGASVRMMLDLGPAAIERRVLDLADGTWFHPLADTPHRVGTGKISLQETPPEIAEARLLQTVEAPQAGQHHGQGRTADGGCGNARTLARVPQERSQAPQIDQVLSVTKQAANHDGPCRFTTIPVTGKLTFPPLHLIPVEVRHLGEQVADAGIDLFVAVGPRSARAAAAARAAAEGAAAGTLEVRHFPDSEEAARFLSAEARPGDLVLVKGSRGIKMERVVQALLGRGR